MVLLSCLLPRSSSKASSDPSEGRCCTYKEEVRATEPELEKESGIEAVVLDCGCFYKLTGCGEGKADKGNIKSSSRVITSFLRRKETNDLNLILC